MCTRRLHTEDITMWLQCWLYGWGCIRWGHLFCLQVWTMWFWTWSMSVLTEFWWQIWLDYIHWWYILLRYRPFIWPYNSDKQRYVLELKIKYYIYIYILTNEFIFKIGLWKGFLKLKFRTLALHQSECRSYLDAPLVWSRFAARSSTDISTVL